MRTGPFATIADTISEWWTSTRATWYRLDHVQMNILLAVLALQLVLLGLLIIIAVTP